MNCVLRRAKIVDKVSPFHLQTKDILIRSGRIEDIGSNLELPDDTFIEVQHNELHVSYGWFDSSVSFGEPGYEERETIAHGLKVAAHAGFTDIALNPDMYPLPDTQATISLLISKSSENPVSLHPVASLTVGSKGQDLAELYDMWHAGAVAFGDYKKWLSNTNLLKIALQYVQGFGGMIQSFPLDTTLAGKGVMNEGAPSTRLGLKGIPALSESVAIARDLQVLEYTGGALHIPTISTAASVALIREAKNKGLNVSCSVAVAQLCLTDQALIDFDTRYKVIPPLRSIHDVEALRNGVIEGTIDMITSDHRPVDIEHKRVEFEYAMYGSVGLDCCYSILQTILTTEQIVERLTAGHQIFKKRNVSIKRGDEARLTLFTPLGEKTLSENQLRSTSKNCAFTGMETKGSVIGIIAKNQLQTNP